MQRDKIINRILDIIIILLILFNILVLFSKKSIVENANIQSPITSGRQEAVLHVFTKDGVDDVNIWYRIDHQRDDIIKGFIAALLDYNYIKDYREHFITGKPEFDISQYPYYVKDENVDWLAIIAQPVPGTQEYLQKSLKSLGDYLNLNVIIYFPPSEENDQH